MLSQGGVGDGTPVELYASATDTEHMSFAQHFAQILMDVLVTRECENSLDMSRWSPIRSVLFKVLKSHITEAIIGCLLLFNLILVIMETDATAYGEEQPLWMLVASDSLMVIYFIELSMRMFIFRSRFFNSIWHRLDFCIVVADVGSWVYFLAHDANGNVGMVTLLRLVRFLRVSQSVHLLVHFPDLILAVKGFVGAFVAATWGMALVLFTLVLFSIVAVQVLHPICQDIVAETDLFADCERCGRAFESVAASMVTFSQQYVAGDSWGTVSIPILERAPFTAPIFITITIVINLMVLNQILAFIVDSSANARRGADHEMGLVLDSKRQAAAKRFATMCKEMDKDQSGGLSYAEIAEAFDEQQEFHDTLKTLGVGREDMECVFRMLDTDESGTIDFNEFSNQLYKMKSSDTQILLCFMRMQVSDISKMVKALVLESHQGLRQEIRQALMQEPGARKEEKSDDLNAVLDEVQRVASNRGLGASLRQVVAPAGVDMTRPILAQVAIPELEEARDHVAESVRCTPTQPNPPDHDLTPQIAEQDAVSARALSDLLESMELLRGELLGTVEFFAPTLRHTTRLLESLNEKLPLDGEAGVGDQPIAQRSCWSQFSTNLDSDARARQQHLEPGGDVSLGHACLPAGEVSQKALTHKFV